MLLTLFFLITSLSGVGEPEPSSGCHEKNEIGPVQNMMVVTSNRLASEAGLDVIKNGGNALDAAIAAQAVLNLVEPQSSGIGGGGFLLYYRAKDGVIKVYDGRETAPINPSSEKNKKEKTVGVPGLVAMLEYAHREEGSAPWEVLFERAIELAEEGFPISTRLHLLIEQTPSLQDVEEAREYLFEGDRPKAEGALLKNPQFAETLRLIAKDGSYPIYRGEIAQKIIRAVEGSLSSQDMARYVPVSRNPLLFFYKDFKIVTVPPPGGGVTVLQILGILEEKNLDGESLDEVTFIRDFSIASRLAYADRNYYLADPAFIPVPLSALINKQYLKYRANSIVGEKRELSPGLWPGTTVSHCPHIAGHEESLSTAQICVVDCEGNMVSFTTSIGDAFGSSLFVGGFFLNNHLTDFSHYPDWKGKGIANALAGGKRPRSAMAPLFVFDRKTGVPYIVLGSAGGARIGEYLSQALVAVLDFDLTLQEAVAAPHYVSMNDEIELEKGSPLEKERQSLESLGYIVTIRPLISGTQGIQITPLGLHGAVDPRREGFAAGE